jgi:hypothetical protein
MTVTSAALRLEHHATKALTPPDVDLFLLAMVRITG